MAQYVQWTALVLIGLILSLVLGKQSKDLSLLLTVAVCVLVGIAAAGFLEPVTELLRQLKRLGDLDSEAVSILLKCAGIGILSELAGHICADAGESAMGKVLQLLSNAVILWLSLPLFQQVLTMIEGVLTQN